MKEKNQAHVVMQFKMKNIMSQYNILNPVCLAFVFQQQNSS